MPWISEVFIFPFRGGNGRLHACKQLQLLSEDHTIWIAPFEVPVRLDKIGSVRRECIIQFAFIFSLLFNGQWMVFPLQITVAVDSCREFRSGRPSLLL
ncbi:hypothetical protein AVEN_16841-1 [Araneus ventricosus]|uniref:Uncharacterized protein n=1 Tax=Araneus ventricosus TaxID=182803 RepID=A0A4Y2BRN1_ARAVE|nr:hypothetical protein AVEN_16841-1 [Araneus ventricosus]